MTKKYLYWLPDSVYLRLRYFFQMHKPLHLKDPKRFTEKLQWLKLYNRHSEYTMMVDKAAVKKYVSDLIGKEYIIPTIGVWDKWEDIDFRNIPDQFVIKTTHGGGGTGVVVVRDKSKMDLDKICRKIERSMGSDIYRSYREWPYKNVTRRIIIEKFISPEDGDEELKDYKFYCFDGKVQCMLVATDRKTSVCFDYFDKDFNHLDFEQGGPNTKKRIEKPKQFERMVEISERLSNGIPHVRVDLYDVNGHIYFGELTFFDSSGFAGFTPDEWDFRFGDYIKLPDKYV